MNKFSIGAMLLQLLPAALVLAAPVLAGEYSEHNVDCPDIVKPMSDYELKPEWVS